MSLLDGGGVAAASVTDTVLNSAVKKLESIRIDLKNLYDQKEVLAQNIADKERAERLLEAVLDQNVKEQAALDAADLAGQDKPAPDNLSATRTVRSL